MKHLIKDWYEWLIVILLMGATTYQLVYLTPIVTIGVIALWVIHTAVLIVGSICMKRFINSGV